MWPKNSSQLAMRQLLDKLARESIHVYTNIEVSSENSEGELVYGKQAFNGTLLDYDDNWLSLGYLSKDKVEVVMVLVKIEDVAYIERLVEEEISGSSVNESGTIN